MDDSQKLLADYVKNGSELAFRELVVRYINLVHSTALRLVNGDSHLAEDITQIVFVNLARKARTLPQDVMLGGWLHRDACFIAGTTMRGERRRHFRERQAMAMNSPEDHTTANLALVAPILDEAINQLEANDRTAILLRFFEQLEFRAVGEAMGSNEDAARMRVTRALEKLQPLLKNRGVTFSVAVLAAALAAGAVTAAPPGLASTVVETALTSGVISGVTAALFKSTPMSGFKIAMVCAIAVAVLVVPVAVQHQSSSKLQAENQALENQVAQLPALQEENQRLSNLVVLANANPELAEKQVLELAKLRNEVARLRQQNDDMAKLQARAGRVSGNQAGFTATLIATPGKDVRGRIVTHVTMADFARYIGRFLQVPVTDQSGLTGTYNIKMTNWSQDPSEGRVEHLTGILLNQLGLQLTPFAGPFTPDETSGGSNGGFAIKLDHLGAWGLMPDTFKGTPGPQELPAGVYEVDTPELPQAIANNLKLIDASKQQWALEIKKQGTATPTWQDLQIYLGRPPDGDMSEYTNASDGEYIIGSVTQRPQFRASPAAVAAWHNAKPAQ